MKPAKHLHIVKDEPTVEDELRALLRARERVRQEQARIEARMLPLRKRYAGDRGEFLLPTVERLSRELLS